MELNSKFEKHVAVFAFPFAYHPSSQLKLALRLASAAPTVLFSFFNTKKSNNILFADISCNNILPYDMSDCVPDDYIFTGKPLESMNLYLAGAEEEARKCVRAAEKDIGMKFSCLVVQSFFWFAADMAEEMKVPLVAYWSAGACSLAAHVYTDLIREKSSKLIGSDEEITDLIPGLEAIRLSDLPGGVVLGDLESPFAVMLHKMGRSLARANIVLANSFQELDPSLTKSLSSELNNFLNIGPSNLISTEKTSQKLEDEYSCISWLDNHKPSSVAYICFGSMVPVPPHELVELAEALEETKTSFLWSINKDSTKHFPKGFLERTSTNGTGKVVPWAPQVQVLNHVAIGVFVTHGGWNSVSESIGAGVPMICRPMIDDEHINSWMVEKVWGIGLRIQDGNLTKQATRCALEQIFSSSKLRDEKIEALKDLAHRAVAPNGSSVKNFKTLVDVVTGVATL